MNASSGPSPAIASAHIANPAYANAKSALDYFVPKPDTSYIPLTLLSMRPLKSMLFGISPFDPAAFALAIAALVLVSGCAALAPARRAASIEPMQALRME